MSSEFGAVFKHLCNEFLTLFVASAREGDKTPPGIRFDIGRCAEQGVNQEDINPPQALYLVHWKVRSLIISSRERYCVIAESQCMST
jgi:hypothetical protein